MDNKIDNTLEELKEMVKTLEGMTGEEIRACFISNWYSVDYQKALEIEKEIKG
jgi:hypothetical protein